MDETPQVWEHLDNGYTIIEDYYGREISVNNYELRDLGRTLIALADEAGE